MKSIIKWITLERLYINMIAKYWRIFFICAIVAFSYMFTFYMGYVFAVEIFELLCLKTEVLTQGL